MQAAILIDTQGYRANVGIVLTNEQGKVFWAKRVGQNAWQFPQGGIQPEETAEQAMYRELQEEVGLQPEDVKILATTPGWLRYRLPATLIRHHIQPLCIGQKQKWFLLRLVAADERIDLNHSAKPEFDNWRWVHYWRPLKEVINFKKHVYRKALQHFLHYNNHFRSD